MRPRCRLRNNAMPPGSGQYGTYEQYGGRNERDNKENRPNHHGSDQHRRRNRYGCESATSSTVGDEHTVPSALYYLRVRASCSQLHSPGEVFAPSIASPRGTLSPVADAARERW